MHHSLQIPLDNPRKATPSEIAWVDLFLNSIPSFNEDRSSVTDALLELKNFLKGFENCSLRFRGFIFLSILYMELMATFGTAIVTTSETSGTGVSSTLGSKPAEGELSATDRAALAELDKMDRKARGLIRICLEDSVLTNVMDQDTANGLWQKLENMYLSKSLVNVLFRRKKLYNLRMHDGDSLAAHLDEFNTLVNQLLAVDVQLTESEKVVTLLCSLPDTWDNLIVAIGGGGLTQMSWESSGDRGKSRGRSKSKDKSKIKCWRCQEFGHFKKDCRNKSVKGKEAETSYKRESNGDMYVAAACMAGSDQSVWYVDTGASFHMTPHKEWFCEYETYNGGNVLLGDDTAL
ncbi:hypothetical protein Patl1_35978 [Pistacia atlantica]|nr:hypothetical protein Patl1_35978 [Pistacia atlantica]